MQRLFFILTLLSGLVLSACQSNPPAPVIERTTSVSKPKSVVPKKTENISNKDWRPDRYTVKKGDTLFAIGLEYGLDYKEIAAANNIASPYTIRVGQVLDLSSFKTKANTPVATNNPTANTSKPEDGVILSPIKTEPAVVAVPSNTPTETKLPTSSVTPVLNEPKASREIYSQEAWNRSTPKPTIATTKPTEATTDTTEAKPNESKNTDTKTTSNTSDDADAINWVWPTQGKISAAFNESSNKGIDIAGTMGQAIYAAAAGKVIYSGSDLRGYGKLVIIKHSKTYLSVYAHNSKILVKEGQSVGAKQAIAEMGNTDSSMVKLHFEIRRLGKSVDPAKYLTQN
jgi:lipoprotein NlpD